jgi:hypothetical protein
MCRVSFEVVPTGKIPSRSGMTRFLSASSLALAQSEPSSLVSELYTYVRIPEAALSGLRRLVVRVCAQWVI